MFVYPFDRLPETAQRLCYEDLISVPPSSAHVAGFDSHFHLDRMLDAIAKHGDHVLRTQSVVKLVGGVINFCDPHQFTRALQLIPYFTHYNLAVGVHPKCVSKLTPDGWEKLVRLLACPRVCAISELGVDYFHVPQAEWPKQWELVHKILGIGYQGKVLVLHLRPAAGDPCGHQLHGEFRELLGKRCVRHQHIHVHNFTGDVEELNKWMVAFPNSFFGVSGLALNFNSAQIAMVRAIPLKRLLLETDSPYLPVIPGTQVNTPYFLEDVGRLVSRIREEEFRLVMGVTSQNARRLYSGFGSLVA